MAGKRMHYDRPAGRKGGYAGGAVRVRVLHDGEIWNDAQRKAYRLIAMSYKEIDRLNAARNAELDRIGILFGVLFDSGMGRARIGSMFKMSASQVDALMERGRTAAALGVEVDIEQEQGQGDQG